MDWSVMKRLLGIPFLSMLVLGLSVGAQAKVEYTLHKSANPTADEQDAYKRITTAVDSAVYMYNKYTHLSKHINVYYAPGVPTAEASSNGDLRFGENRSYMNVRTAMHEMGHTMGMGTTSEYRNMFNGNVFAGPIAQAKLKELTGDPTAELHGDSQHFWPYGLNYDSELHSEQDLIIHCQIVEAMYQDIFKEKFFKEARIMSLTDQKCMGITSTNGLELMDCSSPATITKIWAVGEPVAYRIEFGDRVLDVPNESTAAGVVLGTYYWNGGAHQKTVFEEAPVNTPNAFYLQNYKSKLYLLPDGKNVVQDQRGRLVDSGVWILKEVSAEPPADTSNVIPPADTSTVDTSATDTTLAIYNRSLDRAKAQILQVNPRKFDAKGRAYGESRQKPKYFKLF